MRSHVWKVGLLALLLAACTPTPAGPGTGPSGAPATPSATPSTTPKPTPTPPVVTPGPSGGPEELVVRVDDGTGQVTTWTLRCDPPGGDHPDPEAACTALEQHADALAPVPSGRQCTQQYGGAQTATVTGSWRGEPVSSRFALTDGCEIARWTALAGLLPPAGS